ncbi:hypothetical protein SLEP1_g54734 [Rubroshorea leprosula]|uniref:Uncharacterized protein n=1 Tax=Rubroshorea leprosula TaxID=152421 RepID=A0AAV5MFG0_9ROSI|nr:hypothetical protein SLEP1_g54734 [Rubroshorea leprosula]
MKHGFTLYCGQFNGQGEARMERLSCKRNRLETSPPRFQFQGVKYV